MVTKFIDLSEQVFGRLRVICRVGTSLDRSAIWRCVCQCGNELVTKAKSLRSGETRSCGCLKKEINAQGCRDRLTKHGKTAGGNTRVYRIWANMISRCTNPKFDSYPYYGGRGICVCDRWKKFESFLEDMGEPDSHQSIDRINPDGNYEPSNCQWASVDEQLNNTRRNVILDIEGRRLSVAQWSKEPGAASAKTIYARINRGWDSRRAVFSASKGQGLQ